MRIGILAILASLLACSVNAQVTPVTVEGQFTFDTDKPFTVLDLYSQNEEPLPTKKKKPKKKVYYGLKTKKGFTRKGYGDKMTIELFYYLKKAEKPNGFVRDVYWFDFSRREIRRTTPAGFDPKKGVLVHGPYKRMMGGTVLEEGIFYKGTKHGRWMTHNRFDQLEDKEKYYKGWPKESIVTYYDPDKKTKVKEIIPMEYGEKEGFYYLLHENGQVAVRGEYRWDHKVNEWIENYPTGKRKRVIAYAKDPFDELFRPYVRREFDENGKEIYSNDKEY